VRPVKAVLSSPRLRRIIAGYAINRLGTWFGTVALSLAVFDHTHSALAVAATLIASQVIPALAVPAVVARVEASRGRHELSALYVFEAIVTCALAVLLSHFSLIVVLVLVALDGTAALTASALLRTEAARTAREQAGAGGDAQAAEQHANAAINVAFSATFVLGPAIAGAIVAGPGAPTALFIDAATFLACGTLVFDLKPHVEEAGGESVTARLRAASDYIGRSPALRSLLISQAIGLLFFEAAAPVEVAYAKRTLAAGDRGYGLLVAAWGLGVVLGSILFARAGERRLRLMVSAGTFAIGAAYLGMAAAPTIAVASCIAVVGGVGNGVQLAPLISAVQRLTPPDLHGRVMGALESIGAFSPAVGFALGGGLVVALSPRVAFAIVGAGAALTTYGFARVPVDELPAPAAADSVEPAQPDLESAMAIAAPGAPGASPG
jgi:hypothetical protein